MSNSAGIDIDESKRAMFRDVYLYNDDVSKLYAYWGTPNVIVSDGGYGVSGFKGDANTPSELIDWYQPHLEAWSHYSSAGTTLWFWNTEIGWAKIDPLLDKYGWDYVSANTWDKGIQHIAGNCNLPKLKNFPIVTELCVQYVKRPQFYVEGKVLSLKDWLRYEWERTGLPFSQTNEACGVVNAATRKYFTKCHLWYAPPSEHFEKLVTYANQYGRPENRPYFSLNRKTSMLKSEYDKLFAKFYGQYGVTNVWNCPPLHNRERVRVSGTHKYAHLNQKPLKLMRLIIESSSVKNDLIWEPFGGLCTGGVAAYLTERRALCAEIDPIIFNTAITRFKSYAFDLFSGLQTEQQAGQFESQRLYI